VALSPPTDLTATTVSSTRIDLAWVNGDDYSTVVISRKVSGGSYAVLTGVDGLLEAYQDNSCQDGTDYYYKIRGFKAPDYSDYSNEDDAITPLPAPSGCDGSADSDTSITIEWNDNSTSETGFKVYIDGVYDSSVGQNVETKTKTGLTVGTYYKFKVKAYNAITESAFSNEVQIKTGVKPTAPSLLTAQAVSASQIDLNWQDNSDNETGFKIEEDSGGGFSQIDTVGAGVTHYHRTGRSSNTNYQYKIRAYNTSGNSGYTNTANATTYAAVADPTNLVAVAANDTAIDIYFQDNSTSEDHHCVERRIGANAWVEVKQLEPNRNAWRDTGLTENITYDYQIRALEHGNNETYSNYCANVTCATLTNPAAPSNLAIGNHTDTMMRIEWTGVSNVTGYHIFQSANGVVYTDIITIGGNCTDYLARGLTASTQYWFTLCAYNGAGNSANATAANHTTDAQYEETALEKLLRNPNPDLILLCEIHPKIELSGFALTATKTYTYELTVEERGIDVDAVYENGVAYTETTSIANVEATASTFWFDYYNRLLYIHASDGGDPANFQILAEFTLYFTDSQNRDTPVVFNDNNYLGLLRRDGIPDINHEISRYYEGNFKVSSGRVAFVNAEINPGEYYFDKRYARYIWENAKLVLKAGGQSFTYAQFATVYTGMIKDREMDDSGFYVDLRDLREGCERNLPINKLSTDDYPNLDANIIEDMCIPFYFGTKANVIPPCVDTTNKKYKLHDGRIKSVTSVKKMPGDITLVADTDYFVDYQNGLVMLAEGISMGDGDSLLVEFSGAVNSADELITNGADIFKYICNNFLGLKDTELDLDSIYHTKLDRTDTLSVPLYEYQFSGDVIRQIEHSLRAYSIQDVEGRIGLRPIETAASSDARYVRNHQIFTHRQGKKFDDIFYEVTVYYNLSPKTGYHQWVKQYLEATATKYRTSQALPIYTFLTTEANATTLLSNITGDLDKETITAEVSLLLLNVMPGDIIKYSRDRYYSAAGTASEKDLRILGITKSISSARTTFTAEEI